MLTGFSLSRPHRHSQCERETVSVCIIRFCLLLREIPMVVIFAQLSIANSKAENLEQAPFRWAPKFLLTLELRMNIHMASRRSAERNYHLDSVCDFDGFHFQRNGLLVVDKVGYSLRTQPFSRLPATTVEMKDTF